MEEVYRLFDRRCRTETGMARLAPLRGRVSRCKRLGRALDKLSSPNLEKGMTFLDDKLLPATSNAVERSNRRYRKASITQCGRLNTFASVSPWTCSGISRHRSRSRPRRPCIRPVLGRKNSKNDATASFSEIRAFSENRLWEETIQVVIVRYFRSLRSMTTFSCGRTTRTLMLASVLTSPGNAEELHQVRYTDVRPQFYFADVREQDRDHERYKNGILNTYYEGVPLGIRERMAMH